jgi:CRISPR system Cascade subunit CasA
MRGDSAVWEREPGQLPLANPKRISSGYADLFTWQSRMVLLEELPGGDVSFMRFVAGEGFDNPSQDVDPMQPYKSDKVNGKLPVQFREDRGTWRDFDSMIPDADGYAPQVVQNAVRLAEGKIGNLPVSLLVLGLRYQPPNANADFWRMELFALPRVLAGNKYIRSDIRRLLDAAEDAQKALWSACSSYARHLLSRGDRKPEGKDISGFVSQMSSIPRYWSMLEAEFHDILQEFTQDADSDEIELDWLLAIRAALNDAWDQNRASVAMSDAWAIRALVISEGRIFAKVRELDATIADFKKGMKEDA